MTDIGGDRLAVGMPMVDYEDAPLRAFHIRVAIASTGGVFSDGFGLGIIGIALATAGTQFVLTPLWLGLIGGGALAGLFAGSLLTGPVADRFGRRPVFANNMLLLAIFSLLQFFVASAGQLLVLRFAIGFLLGTDYVVSKTLLTEFTPRRFRGRILGNLSVAWAGGYVCAYFVGFALTGLGDDSWRWMLIASAVPPLLILPVRLTVPESPLWLVDHGHFERAARIVRDKIGMRVSPPAKPIVAARHSGQWRQLLSPAWRRRTLVGCVFFTCQVIPYFALGTFVARVMSALNVEGNYIGGLVYNLFLLLGAISGLLVVDRISRRSFLAGSFAITTATMLALTLLQGLPSAWVIVLFAIFAGVLSAQSNLCYVYLPELFSTEIRASGIGMGIAASRIGSAVSTFLLPIVVAQFGVYAALGACVAVLAFGGIVCQIWAPETRNLRLGILDQKASLTAG